MILPFKLAASCNELSTNSLGVIILVLISMQSSSSLLNTKTVAPQISIQTVCFFDDGKTECTTKEGYKNNVNGIPFPSLDKNNTFVFNDEQELFVEFQCVASYPVEWVHFQEQWLTLTDDNWLHLLRRQSHTFMRTVKSLDDASTFTYTSLLNLDNRFIDSNYAVGQYSCQGIDNQIHASSTKMTVYRERNAYDKVFPLSQKNVTVWTDERDEGTIVFPCYVTNPNVTVNLYRKILKYTLSKVSENAIFTHSLHTTLRNMLVIPPSTERPMLTKIENWDEIQQNDHVWFKPDQGFIFQKRTDQFSIPLSPGIYKCVAMDDSSDEESNDDFVVINLKLGEKPLEKRFSQAISSLAKFNYTTHKKTNAIQINCCSNSSSPPNMYLMSCFSKPACIRQAMHLSQVDMNLHPAVNKLTTVDRNCRRTIQISYAVKLPLNVKCIGEGIDYVATFIFPVKEDKTEKNLVPYFQWEDVDPHKMVALKPINWNERSLEDNEKILLYRNQKIPFQCHTSTAYFAIGSRMTIDYKNGTQYLIPDDNSVAQKNINIKWGFPLYYLEHTLSVTNDIASVSCYAAVVNSKQWVRTTIKVEVKEGKMPTIVESSKQEERYWTLNDTSKRLYCEFAGIPSPTNVIVRNSTDPSDPYNYSIPLKNTSILVVNVVTYDSHGVYECTVGNIFGNVTKTIRVFVRAPESNWIFMSVTLGVACFTIALIVLGIYTRRERKKYLSGIKAPFENDNGIY